MRTHGFTLVELLVGMFIALLVVMAAWAAVKATTQAARRVTDDNTMWHDARISLLALGTNIQNAGYMLDLTSGATPNPVVVRNQVAGNYLAPGGFQNQSLTLVTNVSGVPGQLQPDTWQWALSMSAQSGNPALLASESGVGSSVDEYADGVVALRFQVSCHNDPSTYYSNAQACPGGIADMRSVRVCMLVRELMPDPSNKIVATDVTFPDGSVYVVPSSNGAGCLHGDCTRYRHQLFIAEFPLRNLAWGL